MVINMMLFLSLILFAAASTTNVPPETDVTTISIRIGQKKEITTPPTFPFQSIYSKAVYVLDSDNNEKDFLKVCHETPADIIYTKQFSYAMNISTENKDIIYNFDDIKADRRILDTTLQGDRVYLLLRENALLVFDIKAGGRPVSINIPADGILDSGFFVQVSQTQLVLVTSSQAFKIEGQQISRLSGFENITDLESARDLFGNYFVVCGVKTGVIIYTLEGSSLTKQIAMDAAFFDRPAIFISDVAYNPDDDELFVSDEKFGINIVKLHKNETSLHPELSNMGYRKVGCYVIVYHEGNLYAACDDLFRVQYSTDDLIVDIPNPLFKVKELLVYKGLIVAVGEDIVAKYYNDKLAAKGPELEEETERLIFFDDNKYLMANYNVIEVGTYNLTYPSIVCSTVDPDMEGVVNAVIKTEAECSMEYFQSHGLLLNVMPERCIYTSPVQLIFWKGEDFDMGIIFVAMGILFVFAAIITTWAIFMYTKEINLRRTLDTYMHPSSTEMRTETAVPDYNVLAEEKESNQSPMSDLHASSKEDFKIEKGDLQENDRHSIE